MKLRQVMESVIDSDSVAKDKQNAKEISKVLFAECAPWLSRYGFDLLLYRAKSMPDEKPYTIMPVHQDRYPRTTAPQLHELFVKHIDDAAEANDIDPGYANRQNSAFCFVNRMGGADAMYGNAFVYFPIGEFRTTHMKGIEDLFVDMGKELRNVSMDLKNRSREGAHASEIKALADRAEELFHNDPIIKNAPVVFDDISGVGTEEVMVRSDRGLYIPQDVFRNPTVNKILKSRLK